MEKTDEGGGHMKRDENRRGRVRRCGQSRAVEESDIDFNVDAESEESMIERSQWLQGLRVSDNFDKVVSWHFLANNDITECVIVHTAASLLK
jgi:hypothetical protein